MRFADLQIGDAFDFIDKANPSHNSFVLRCKKTSARKYTDERGIEHRVGSVYCYVFNVVKAEKT